MQNLPWARICSLVVAFSAHALPSNMFLIRTLDNFVASSRLTDASPELAFLAAPVMLPAFRGAAFAGRGLSGGLGTNCGTGLAAASSAASSR